MYLSTANTIIHFLSPLKKAIHPKLCSFTLVSFRANLANSTKLNLQKPLKDLMCTVHTAYKTNPDYLPPTFCFWDAEPSEAGTDQKLWAGTVFTPNPEHTELKQLQHSVLLPNCKQLNKQNHTHSNSKCGSWTINSFPLDLHIHLQLLCAPADVQHKENST